MITLPVLLSTLTLLALSTVMGVGQVTKLIRVREARHELKRGSAGWLRTIAGWSMIAVWIGGTWFVATVIGDWGASGDLDGAIARGQIRLWVLLEILSAIAATDG